MALAILSAVQTGALRQYSISSNTLETSGNIIVFPAQYSNVAYSTSASYSNIGYVRDLESFSGFLGIQAILLDPKVDSPSKEQIFTYGKFVYIR